MVQPIRFRALIIGALTAALALPLLPAHAGSRGRLNTAAVLSGAALYTWAKSGHSAGRRNTALATTAGAAYAWSRYSKARKTEHRRRLAQSYSHGRRAGAASVRSRANVSARSAHRTRSTRIARLSRHR